MIFTNGAWYTCCLHTCVVGSMRSYCGQNCDRQDYNHRGSVNYALDHVYSVEQLPCQMKDRMFVLVMHASFKQLV